MLMLVLIVDSPRKPPIASADDRIFARRLLTRRPSVGVSPWLTSILSTRRVGDPEPNDLGNALCLRKSILEGPACLGQTPQDPDTYVDRKWSLEGPRVVEARGLQGLGLGSPAPTLMFGDPQTCVQMPCGLL